MKPREPLGGCTGPDGQELTFYRRDGVYFVDLDGEELMSSREPGSEKALAEMSCRDLGEGARVLIGGLGLGFTLQAALEVLPRRSEVVVAEYFRPVIDFNLKYLREMHGKAFDDPRTRIIEADVCRAIVDRAPWDAILLDVDNGPEASSISTNERLYDRAGLERIHSALRPGGVLAVWSAYPDPRFVKTLRRRGFEAESRQVRSRGSKGARHTIFFGRRTR